jgi:putative membrane protein insertion efficiency factor
MGTVAIAAIRFYQNHLRHWHNRVCIYEPSCSEYMIVAISKYGALRGIWYGRLRIRRCNGAMYAGGPDHP